MKTKISQNYVHRIIWETFYGEIPSGYQIDHINTIRDDNRLENLRCVTPKENANNPLTNKHYSEAQKGKTLSEETKRKISKSHKGVNTWCKGKTHSEFGIKFKEHFGITNYENPKLYHREYMYYSKHNKTCRWEMNTDERN